MIRVYVKVEGQWTDNAPVLGGHPRSYKTAEEAKVAARVLDRLCDGSWTAYELRDELGNVYGGREMPVVTASAFREACANSDGWCSCCEEFTRDGGVEPDATGYCCPKCEGCTVMGAEQAVVVGAVILAWEAT